MRKGGYVGYRHDPVPQTGLDYRAGFAFGVAASFASGAYAISKIGAMGGGTALRYYFASRTWGWTTTKALGSFGVGFSLGSGVNKMVDPGPQPYDMMLMIPGNFNLFLSF